MCSQWFWPPFIQIYVFSHWEPSALGFPQGKGICNSSSYIQESALIGRCYFKWKSPFFLLKWEQERKTYCLNKTKQREAGFPTVQEMPECPWDCFSVDITCRCLCDEGAKPKFSALVPETTSSSQIHDSFILWVASNSATQSASTSRLHRAALRLASQTLHFHCLKGQSHAWCR